ncbi:MAG: hypothetical protein WD696_16725 [Bryobacteraceae bacterium]
MRLAIGVAFLAFQIAAIVYARYVPSRYFCWAPFDMQTEYWLEVTVDGRPLNGQEIRRRYRRPQHGVDNRSPQHVIDIVQQCEERYAAAERVRVRMRYTVNGKEERQWHWPPR